MLVGIQPAKPSDVAIALLLAGIETMRLKAQMIL